MGLSSQIGVDLKEHDLGLNHTLPYGTGLFSDTSLVRPLPMRVNLTGAAAIGAHIPRIPEGSRISRVRPWIVKRTYREVDPTAWTAAAP